MKDYVQPGLYTNTRKRLTGKPPRPRQSVSPALRNTCTKTQMEVCEKDVQSNFGDIITGKSDLLSTYDLVRSEDISSNEEYSSPILTDLCSPESSANSSSPDEQLREDNLIQQASFNLVSANPRADLSHVHMPVAETASTQSPVLQKSFTPFPFTRTSEASTDILAQWRLKRKMEIAQFAGRTLGYNFSQNPWFAPQLSAPLWTHRTPFDGMYEPVLCQGYLTKNDGLKKGPHLHYNYATTTFKLDKATQSQAISDPIAFTVYTQTHESGPYVHPSPKTLRDSSVMTDNSAASALIFNLHSLRPEQRSIKTMASPRVRDASAQTYVVCSYHSQQTGLIGRTKTTSQRSPPFPHLLDQTGSDQYTDADSWSWPPSPTGPPVNSVIQSDASAQTADPVLVECFMQTNRTVGSTNIGSSTSSVAEMSTSNHCSVPKPNCQDVCDEVETNTIPPPHSIHMGSRIAQYLQQKVDSDPVDPQWLRDEIVQTLLKQRSECLARMKRVIGEISEREMALVETVSSQNQLTKSTL